MKVLVVGSGGREHAITWALSRSRRAPELLIAPGNPGTAALGENIGVRADDVEGLLDLATSRSVDLCIVGPEAPLVLGLADRLRRAGIPVVGPDAAAARLEGSKAFAKAFMERHGIPTAAYRTFSQDQFEDAVRFVRAQGAPIVVKASGLAAGKGAVVCPTVDDAIDTLDGMLRRGDFGESAERVVVEEFMTGEEASLFAFCDGSDYVVLAPAQDHKRIGEGDTGPNTGGMGAYCPAPVVTESVLEQARREIIEPTLKGMAAEGCPYKGILYVGLMIKGGCSRVVEYNCRLGDPETQPVLMLLDSDPLDLFEATAAGRLAHTPVDIAQGAAACVVAASKGYPAAYEKGKPIAGLGQAAEVEGTVVFQAGTSGTDSGIVTAGGRVLGITARGVDLEEALQRVYRAVDAIHFEGMQVRRDIGRKGLSHLSEA